MVNMTDFSRNNTIRDNWSNNSASALAGVQRQFNTYLEPQIEGAEQLSQSLDNLIQPFLNRERDEVIKNKMIEKSAASKAKADSRALELTKQLSKYDIQDAVMDNADINSMEKFNMPLDQVQRNLDNIARGYGFSSKEALMGALNSEYNGDTRLTKVKKDSNLLGYIEEYKSIMKDYDRTRDGNLNSKDLLNIATTLTAKHPTSTLESNMKYLQEVLGSQSEASGSINSLITKLESENMYNNQELYGDTNYGSGKSNNTQNTNPLIKRTNSSSNTNISNTSEPDKRFPVNAYNNTELNKYFGFNPIEDSEKVKKVTDQQNKLIKDTLKTDTGSWLNKTTQNFFRENELQKPFEDALNGKTSDEVINKLENLKKDINKLSPDQHTSIISIPNYKGENNTNKTMYKFIPKTKKVINESIKEIDNIINLFKDPNTANILLNPIRNKFYSKEYKEILAKGYKEKIDSKDIDDQNSADVAVLKADANLLVDAIKDGIVENNGKEINIYGGEEGEEIRNEVLELSKNNKLVQGYANYIMHILNMLNGGPDKKGGTSNVANAFRIFLPILKNISKNTFTGEGFTDYEKKINSALDNIKINGSVTLRNTTVDPTILVNLVKSILANNSELNKDGKVVLKPVNTGEPTDYETLKLLATSRIALASMGVSTPNDYQKIIDDVRNQDKNK